MDAHTHTHNLIKQFFTYKHIIISCVCVCARRVQILSGFCGAASARSEAETVSMATDPSSIPPPVESEMKGFMWWKEKGKKKRESETEKREEKRSEEKKGIQRGREFIRGDEEGWHERNLFKMTRWKDRESEREMMSERKGKIEEEDEQLV